MSRIENKEVTYRNAVIKAEPYKISDGGGMYLLVHQNGSKYWRLGYRFGGKQKTLALGVYQGSPHVSLVEARAEREKAKILLKDGIDPGQDKQLTIKAREVNAANTFKAVAVEWHENKVESWTTQYGINVLVRLTADIFPEIGDRPIRDIEPPEMLAAIRKIEKRGALDVAKRNAQVCGQIFRYAIATGKAVRNPIPDIKDAFKPSEKTNFASIATDEIPAFVRALNRNDARLFVPTRIALRLMMLTFVRTSNLINARWKDFNLETATWTIPASEMKQRKVAKANAKNVHIVPLASQALALLVELKAYSGDEYLFVCRTDHKKPMSNGALLMALRRMGYQNQMTGHGFRALAMSTIKERLKYRHEVIDRQLAHVHKSATDAAYDRAQFLDERRGMMQQWADYLDSAAAGAKIIPLYGTTG
jgi:integrase